MKIYTKGGDGGETGLFDGSRVRKDDPRCEAYGDVDELNSVIGAARAFVEEKEIDGTLESIQRDLFAIGAQLADPKYDPVKRKEKVRITQERIEIFEQIIDRYDKALSPLKGFILPCGTNSGAMLHLARTVCRRAERKIVSLSAKVEVPELVLIYINRLSDLLFVLARMENKAGGELRPDDDGFSRHADMIAMERSF